MLRVPPWKFIGEMRRKSRHRRDGRRKDFVDVRTAFEHRGEARFDHHANPQVGTSSL
jgi:hypothetical protein